MEGFWAERTGRGADFPKHDALQNLQSRALEPNQLFCHHSPRF
jgi:hypothetical protein